jgi:CBS domain containing-hemolysin-like protein
MAGSGNRFARMLLPIVEDSRSLDRFVAACQIGITASSLVLGAYGQNVFTDRLAFRLTQLVEWIAPRLSSIGISADGLTTALATSISAAIILIILTFLQVILGELFPKSVAVQYPERLAMITVLPVKWAVFLFRPLIWFFNGSGNLILRMLGVDIRDDQGKAHSPEEIEILVTESHQGGLLDDEERQMLRNAFRMRDLTARQVMVHRTRIIAAPLDSNVEDILNLALEVGHTRIPLYQDSIDKIIGFVHIKDLFRLYVSDIDNLAEILREIVFVPETTPIVDVWEILGARSQYMALVFDEFGGTAGLITFEDLIEEIFGELQDEFDDETALISLDPEGRVHLRGDLLVADVNEYLRLKLPETADTLGGLILSELGRSPKIGDEIKIGDTIIRVEEKDDLSVSEVSIETVTDEANLQASDWEVGKHD